MIRWFPPLLGALACAVPAAAQETYAPRPITVLVVRDTTGGARPPELHDFARGPTGRFYLGVTGRPLASFAPDGSAGAYLRGADGQPLLGRELAWMGDTLAARRVYTWDLLSPDDRALECRAFEEMHNEFATQVFPLQPLAGGLALGERTPPYPDDRVPQALVVSRGQTVVRVLRERPSGPRLITVPFPWGGGALQVWPPFAARTLWAASDDGAHVVVVESEQPAAPGPHPVRVLRMDVEGRVAVDASISLPAHAVTEGDRRRQIEAWTHSMAGGTLPRDTAAARRAFAEAVAFPAYHPAVTDLRVARDGSAWLRVGDEDGRPAWLRVGPAGQAGERMVLDSAFTLRYADEDALWGGLRDPDGSLRVVGYPLPGRPPLFAPGFAGFALPAEVPVFSGPFLLMGGGRRRGRGASSSFRARVLPPGRRGHGRGRPSGEDDGWRR